MSTTLNHYNDIMGPDTAATLSQLRSEYTNGQPGSGDDPIGTHRPVAIDQLVSNLRKLIAKAEDKAYETTAGLQGEIDDQVAIDPTLSYGENKAKIQDRYGVEFDTEERARLRALDSDNESRQRKRARETIADNLDAIKNGEKEQLVSDIESEFGAEFVADAIERIKAERVAAEQQAEQLAADPIENESAESEQSADVEPDQEQLVEIEQTVGAETVVETDSTTEPEQTETEQTVLGTVPNPARALSRARDCGGVVTSLLLFVDLFTRSVVMASESGGSRVEDTGEQATLTEIDASDGDEPTEQTALDAFGAEPAGTTDRPAEPVAEPTPDATAATTEQPTLEAY